MKIDTDDMEYHDTGEVDEDAALEMLPHKYLKDLNVPAFLDAIESSYEVEVTGMSGAVLVVQNGGSRRIYHYRGSTFYRVKVGETYGSWALAPTHLVSSMQECKDVIDAEKLAEYLHKSKD